MKKFLDGYLSGLNSIFILLLWGKVSSPIIGIYGWTRIVITVMFLVGILINVADTRARK